MSLALYLASDDSTFMTGAVIPIDGGWSVQLIRVHPKGAVT